MDSSEKVKSRWTRSFFSAFDTRSDDCCHLDLGSPSNLALHRDSHMIERPYKCEACQVSFNTQGHLQKHRRSSAHETRLAMTQAFGLPSSDNPRPYGCTDCDIAFRKHGHLAKHLRSKSHITKLESHGLVPNGTYALIESAGPAIKERIVTTNSELALQSISNMATSLFESASEHQMSKGPMG